jgi:F-type H+-transporting ATPase subunit epsilon
MPHTKFQVEILTPEGAVFDDEVEMVSTRTTVGLIGILANHSPVLGTLEPTELRLHRSDTEILRFAQSEGYLQVAGNHAMLLVQDAIPVDQLDASTLRERLTEAERELEAAGEETERRRIAQRDSKRWQTFLDLAEGR